MSRSTTASALSSRGNGYAAEALTALLTVAVSHGLDHVGADNEPDNIASQRTLERAGFSDVGTEPGLFHYEATLRPD